MPPSESRLGPRNHNRENVASNFWDRTLAVIKPINEELGHSMAVPYEDVVDFGKLKASIEYFCTDEETNAA
jgi:hypothetical protein